MFAAKITPAAAKSILILISLIFWRLEKMEKMDSADTKRLFENYTARKK